MITPIDCWGQQTWPSKWQAMLLAFYALCWSKLDRELDVRLVRTLANTVLAIVRHRNRALGLLLSELGDHLLEASTDQRG